MYQFILYPQYLVPGDKIPSGKWYILSLGTLYPRVECPLSRIRYHNHSILSLDSLLWSKVSPDPVQCSLIMTVPTHETNYWFIYCFTALQHYYGHFEHGLLTCQHCSWEGFLSGQPVLSAHTCTFASNWQLLYLNQRQGENGRINNFMTKSLRKMVPDPMIEPLTSWIPIRRHIWLT